MNQRLFTMATACAVMLWLAHCVSVFLYPLGNDPAIFQYHAWAMSLEKVPYLDSLDVNTPGIILLHWFWGTLAGYSDTAFLALTMLLCTGAIFGSLWVLRKRAREALLVALAVSLWAFVSITPWDRGQREIFQGVLLLLALYSGSRNVYLWAGIFLGAAVTIKASVLLVLAPAGIVWLWRFRPGIPAFRTLLAGAAVPIVGVLIWLAAVGAWDDYWWIQWHYLPHHRGQFTVPWQEAVKHPLAMWVSAIGLASLFCGALGQLLSTTLLAAVGLYLFQRHGWSYHLHVVVPLLLVAALGVAERLIKSSQERWMTSFVAAGLLVLSLFNIHYDCTRGLTRAHQVDSHWDYDAHQQVAAFLQKQGPPSDRVLTNNDEQQLLVMARRRGATRCLYSFVCSEAHSEPVFQRLSKARLAQVEQRPLQWVVWNTQFYAAKTDSLEANPLLAAWIVAHCSEKAPIGPYRLWRCSDLTE